MCIIMLPVVDEINWKDQTAYHGVLDLYPGLDWQTYIVPDGVYDMK